MLPSALEKQAAPAPSVQGWGLISYRRAWRRQLDLWRAICEGRADHTLAFCQHPPTITLGRHAPTSDVLLSRAQLERRGIELVRSDRGGRATVHAPGQAVVYPVVAVARLGLGTRAWVAMLEDAVLETLAALGIASHRRPGRPGLWTGEGKIAFVGLRIARGVSYHGLAVNVDLDVSLFDCIVPCGAASDRITSVAAHLGTQAPSADAIARRVCAAISTRIGELQRT